MNNPYDDDQEKLLSLSLATSNVRDIDRRNKKRKRTIKRSSSSSLSTSINNNNIKNSYEYHESFESKVLRLIQTREEMLRQGQFRQYRQENNNGLHLIHLLLVAAAATAKGSAGAAPAASSALESLSSLYSGASLTGDSVQRVVAHFADALAARLLTQKSPFFHLIMKGPTAEEELSAFAGLYRASPLFQFAHFTANQAILEAMDNSTSAHIIDFDVSYGFQWPSLIQSLADQNRTASLRITGFGTSADELRETEERLTSFAGGFQNLSFEFRGVLSLGFDEDFHGLLKENIRENEILAVNLVLYNNDKSTTLLNMVRSLNPTVVVLVEQEVMLSSSSSFVARFVESLHYFAAMFDSLDDSLPSDSAERLRIEKNHLGPQIKALLNQDDVSRRSSTVVVMSWRERMESHGFSGVKMSSKAVIQAKLLLKMKTNSSDQYGGNNDDNSIFCGGFRVSERDEGMAISLGWQNRYLITASVWQ